MDNRPKLTCHEQNRLHTGIDALEVNVTHAEHPSKKAAYCIMCKKVTTVNVHLNAVNERKIAQRKKRYHVWSLFIFSCIMMKSTEQSPSKTRNFLSHVNNEREWSVPAVQ